MGRSATGPGGRRNREAGGQSSSARVLTSSAERNCSRHLKVEQPVPRLKGHRSPTPQADHGSLLHTCQSREKTP